MDNAVFMDNAIFMDKAVFMIIWEVHPKCAVWRSCLGFILFRD